MTTARHVGIFAALAGALAVKLAVLVQLGDHPLLVPAGELDGAYYYHFAQRVAAGDVWLLSPDGFFGREVPAFFISPLYIYFLAACLKIGGSLDAARFIQVLLGTAAVGLIAATAARWYGRRAGWFAGALAACCGLFAFYEILILQASLEPFLTALDLYLLTRALQHERPSSWIAAGGALGLHSLNRPNMLIVVAGLAVLVLARAIVRRSVSAEAGSSAFADATADSPEPWRRRSDPAGLRSRRLAAPVLLLAAAALVISPATLRNWRATGELVPISSHGGLNFLIGNSAEADGTFTSVMRIEPSVQGQWLGAPAVAAEALGRSAGPNETSRFFAGQAWSWIAGHPRDVAMLFARKVRYALSATFLTLNHGFPFFAGDLRGPLTWLAVGPLLIVPLGLVGLVAARPRERGYWIWAAYVPLALASIAIFFVAARYRLPLQVALTVAAGGALAWFASRLHARQGLAVAAGGASVVAIAVFVGWPTGLDDGRAEERVRMGLYDVQAGRVAEGEAWIARAIESHAYPGVVHVRVGQVYESLNRPTEALTHYRAAAAIDRGELAVRFALGRALFSLGQHQDAIAELLAAQAGPQRDAATRLLVLAYTRLGRVDDANRTVRTLDPSRWSADEARQFGEALAVAGRADLSIAALGRAAEASGLATDYERLGLTWVVLDRHADALEAFREGVRREPAAASLRLNHAVALAGFGRTEEARAEAEAALQIKPGYERAKQLLRALPERR